MLHKETITVYCVNQRNKKCRIFSFNPDGKSLVSEWLISNTTRITTRDMVASLVTITIHSNKNYEEGINSNLKYPG
jgi:hypothetical protein